MSESFKYINERIDDQIGWHSQKSKWNKQRYYFTEVVLLLSTALIPVINVFNILPNTSLTRILSAVLGAVGVIASGVSKLYKFQENWLNYRALTEALRREKEFYVHQIGAYETAAERGKKILVVNVENLLASATSQFVSVHRSERDQLQDSPAPFQLVAVPSEVLPVSTETNEPEPNIATGEEDEKEEGAEPKPPKEGSRN
jgi:hypothetical protein